MQALDAIDHPRQAVAMLALAAIVAVGAVLRLYALDSQLWYDEIVTLTDSARASFPVIVTQFPSNNNHVFYSILAHASIGALGEHPWTLRLPAFVFAVASLPMLYLLGVAASSRWEALWATALLAVSYHHVWFAQNARGYTILLFCALLSTWLLLRALRQQRNSTVYVAYAIVSALSAYTHLTMVLFVLGQGIVVALHILDRDGWRPVLRSWVGPAIGFAGAAALTLALYAPMLLQIGSFFGREAKGAVVATPGWALMETLRGLRLGYAAEGGLIVGAILVMAGCWSYFRKNRLAFGLFVVPATCLVAMVVILQRPTFPRFFFFLAGFALLILVRGTVAAAEWTAARFGAANTRERTATVLATAALAAMTVVSALAVPAAYRFPKQDYEQALRYVEATAASGDAIVTAGGGTSVPYRTYFGKPWERLGTADDLARLRGQHQAVWILHTFRRYVEALEPDLARAMSACPVVRTFRGSVADGDIFLSRCAENQQPR